MMKKETARENSMSRPHSQKLRPGNCYWSGILRFRAHPLQPGLPNGQRIRCFRFGIGCCWLAGTICAWPVGLIHTGELRLLQNQRPLQNHLDRLFPKE